MHFPKEELECRIQRLQEELKAQGIGGALILQNMDLVYFSGTAQNAYLYIPQEGKPVLMVRKSAERAAQESALELQVRVGGPRDIPVVLSEQAISLPDVVGLEMDVLPVREYFRYQRILGNARLVDISEAVRKIRAVKSGFEQQIIRRAAQLHDHMFVHASTVLKEGLKEVEFAAEVECFSRKQGHMGFVHFRGFNQELFFGHLMSGAFAALPSGVDSPTGGPGIGVAFPQSCGLGVIERGVPVEVDYVGYYDSYVVDQTRIFAIGHLPEKLHRAHQVAMDIQDAVADRARPGVACAELYELAVKLATEAGFRENFMGFGYQVPYVGHGVGLEVNELPIIGKGIDHALEEGMVVALEPKFVFPGEGVVGVEDTFIIGKTGAQRLGSFPRQVCIV